MSRWSHEYPERDYSDGSYFGRDPGTRDGNEDGVCLACEAPTHKRENLCLECEQQVKHGLEERRLQDAGR